MTREPHQVLSCDTCDFAEDTNSRSYPKKCTISKPVPMMVCKECIGWFAYVGCASHSSHQIMSHKVKVGRGFFVLITRCDDCPDKAYGIRKCALYDRWFENHDNERGIPNWCEKCKSLMRGEMYPQIITKSRKIVEEYHKEIEERMKDLAVRCGDGK